MLMVIFGAGASFDSYASSPGSGSQSRLDAARPPLANDLFAERGAFIDAFRSFPRVGPLVSRLRHLKPTESIEDRLEHFQSEGGSDPERIRQLASVRFYIQDVISECDMPWHAHHVGQTNYQALLDEIRHHGHEKVSLVTFNYDRLLDWAVEFVTGRKIVSIVDYADIGPFALFKVHGSVNWGRIVSNSPLASETPVHQIARWLIEEVSALRFTDEYVLVQDQNRPLVRDRETRGNILFPAIAIPVKSKSSFECPAAHITNLVSRMGETDRILVLGWRGMEQHFLGLLRENVRRPRVKIQIANGSPEASKETAERLRVAGIDADYDVRGVSFTEYILDDVGREFLRR